MIGHQEISITLYVIALFMLILCLFAPIFDIVKILLIASIIFSLFSVIWINYIISHNRLQPLINRIRPNEIVWLRFSKDGMFIPQLVKKGPYGQTKGVIYKQKCDVINKGDYNVKLISGNNAIVMNDMMSTNVNLDDAVVWQEISDKYNVDNVFDAYKKSKEIEKKNIKDKKYNDLRSHIEGVPK